MCYSSWSLKLRLEAPGAFSKIEGLLLAKQNFIFIALTVLITFEVCLCSQHAVSTAVEVNY